MYPGYSLANMAKVDRAIKSQFLSDQKKAGTCKTRPGAATKVRTPPRSGGRRCG